MQNHSLSPSACPCGSGKSYDACCGVYHGGAPVPNAEALMRARYTAYVQRRSDFLLATWHESTRPATLDLSDRPGLRTNWLGLQVISFRQMDAQRAEVSFIARLRIGAGGAQRIVERSQFVFENGQWLYVDGEIGPKK
ncbi:MAG TPA: YchJ family metal-binding protein [Aquimonas sp.]|jgi:SEC-C motif domain protein|nr:SEC-C domain-containing protein [Xanthomonadales bacterium]HRD71639.1 YchJ family metal-binding protein [Aquimonas sp.]HRF53015.1 YchJ family metal-binding protein [Aquimonas sp.]